MHSQFLPSMVEQSLGESIKDFFGFPTSGCFFCICCSG